ncbi:unnamed protein product, partial [Medioppia subpectinata]
MSIKFDFTGKVVLVTGSSSGIGAATAVQFAQSGAIVVVTGRRADKIAEVAKECLKVSPKGIKALEVTADVTKRVNLQRLVYETINHFGKLDILVNNAGAGILASVQDKDYYDNFKKVMAINLNSVVYLTHICVEHLEKTKGNIINISSIAGLRTFIGFSPYCMAKCALDMFTQCMAAELGPKRIRVNVINPGPVRTGFSTAMGTPQEVSDKTMAAYSDFVPIGRVGEPDDLAHSILYLASDHAAFVTGSIVLITGSSSGIGAATAVQFSKAGAQLVVTGPPDRQPIDTATECLKVSPKGLKALEVTADVTKREDMRRLVDQTIKHFGKLDILVNNAGAGIPTRIDDIDYYDKFEKIMAINLNSIVYLTHICVEHLEKTKGNIINVSSVAGLIACMAAELGPKRIRVNTISPGPIRTQFYETSGLTTDLANQLFITFAQKLPVGRQGITDDVANTVLNLTSDHAQFSTGDN